MVAAQHQLQRSRNAVLGGVCAGIAEYLDADPIVVRILFAALTVLTLGAAVVPYAILCVALPCPRLQEGPLDVDPEEAHSALLGNLDACAMRDRKSRAAMASALRQVGSAHVPPSPPTAAGNEGAQSGEQQSEAIPSVEGAQLAGFAANSAQGAQGRRDFVVAEPQDGEPLGRESSTGALQAGQPGNGDFRAARCFQGSSANHRDVSISASSMRMKLAVALALVGGSILLSVGVSIVVTALIEGAVWWECWPLIFIVLGFVRITVPGRADRRSAMFASGACSCFFGMTLLMASLGIISWDSFGCMIENLWPLLAAYVLLALVGIRLRNRALIIASAFCFVLFCVLGLQLCAFPGPLHEFTFVTPLGREYPVVAPFSHVV